MFRPSLFLLLISMLCSCQKSSDPERLYRANSQLIATGLESILSAQSYLETGTALSVFDFDHTLGDTMTMIPVQRPDGSSRLVDSKCIDIKPEEKPDYTVFNALELSKTQPIQESIATMQQSLARNTVVVITARGQHDAVPNLQNYLARFSIKPAAILPINNKDFQENIWNNITLPPEIKKLPGMLKKPFIIAALIDRAEKKGIHFSTVDYHEDTDRYVNGSMALLGKLHPKIQFEIFDYVRKQGNPNEYTKQRAVFSRDGQWFLGQNSQPLPANREYTSNDCAAESE